MSVSLKVVKFIDALIFFFSHVIAKFNSKMTNRHLTAIMLLSFSVAVSCHSYPYSGITDNEIIRRLDATDQINHQPKEQVTSKRANPVFKAVWNVPRNDCKTKFGLDLNLESYGILANADGADWNGEAITIFYNEHIGLYPAFEMTADGHVRKTNAGLPQVTCLFAFLSCLNYCVCLFAAVIFLPGVGVWVGVGKVTHI